jgi:hypothetical protein
MNSLFPFYYIPYGFSLFFMFAYLILKQSNGSPFTTILLILLFLAMTFSYYTSAFVAIILAFLFRLRTKRLWLVMSFVVIFISVEVIIYTQTAIQVALFNAAHSSTQQICFNLQKYFEELILTTSQPGAYVIIIPYFINPILQVVGSLNRIFIILYIISSFLLNIYIKRMIKFARDLRFWFVMSLAITAVLEIFVYLFMNYQVVLRTMTIALILFMAYFWPPELLNKLHDKAVIYRLLAVIIVTSAVCLPILNFTRSYIFSIDYGSDYGNFYQKANDPILFLLLHEANLVYTDHLTDAILTYKAIHLDIKYNLRTVVITKESTKVNTGCFILPCVKVLSTGWEGYIPSLDFRSMFVQKNIIYTSGFFIIYHIGD